jgi:hypothetical protein
VVDVLSSLACAAPIASRALALKVFSIRSPNALHESRLKSQLTLLRKLTKRRLGDFTFDARMFQWMPKLPVIVLVPLAPLLEARIESFLLQAKSSSARALAKRFGQSIVATKKALDALVDRGAVQRLRGEQFAARSAIDGIGQVQLF